MFDQFYCALIKFANFIIGMMFNWWVDMLIWVIGLLPDADFSADPIEWGVFGNSIGYFIPVSSMASHFAMILSALVLFYGIQHILRLIRLIG